MSCILPIDSITVMRGRGGAVLAHASNHGPCPAVAGDGARAPMSHSAWDGAAGPAFAWDADGVQRSPAPAKRRSRRRRGPTRSGTFVAFGASTLFTAAAFVALFALV